MLFDAFANSSARNLRFARILATLTLATSGILVGASPTFSVKRDIETIVTLAPAPVMVAKGRELISAEKAASEIRGAVALLGAGESMNPLYVSGTAIVVTPCEFNQLRPGMSVVYVNQNGRGVAHVLVKETSAGWVAQGVNNRKADATLVTRDNLVGVITQAYASSDTPARREIALRATLKAAKALGSQLALNLPKTGPAGLAIGYQEGTN